MENRTPAVSMRDITKVFGTVVANDGVNLDIYRGEILSLLGENGSGKTTLMNMLSGIYYPDGGQIYIDSSLISAKVERTDVTVFSIPATQMAKDAGVSTLANMIMMGHVLENNPELSFAGTEVTVSKLVPPKKAQLVELNMNALTLGKEYKA